MRDLYNNQELQESAWNFCCRYWDPDILACLTGEDIDGNKVECPSIIRMLEQIDDLGLYTIEEWKKFFEIVRAEGI